MSIVTRMRYGLAGILMGLKQSDVAFIPQWVKTTWAPATFQRLTAEGYKKNAAVNICLTKLALAYQQPRPIVKSMDGDLLPNHPLQKLLIRPNPQMSWRELALITAVYKGIGGQCYLKKVRSARGLVVELWPYHIGQIRPVPGRYEWVSGYEYNDGESDWQPIDKADVVHLKWPIIDPDQPWMALSPLISLAREVDTDNEATRYQYALLFNDATPRTALRIPPGGRPMTPLEVERIKASWRQKYGGDNRGDVAILEAGAEIVRTSLNMEELAFDALRKVPEARISAGFLIPPEYSGLTVGLEHSTYNNVNEARRGFFEDTIVQLLALDSGEIEQDLGQDFGGDVIVEHDLSKVVALQENEDAKWTRAVNGWDKGLITQNEGRQHIGLAETPGGDVFKAPSGPMQLPGGSQIIDVTPPKRKQIARKASPSQTRERRIEKALQKYLAREYERAAQAVA
jgi:HK97 family phage portal protein